ncbi:MAG: class I SAM-dependent methyltransferase [Acidimicrobiales bacterium]
MDSSGWDQRYAGDELVWKAEANRFLAAEVEALPPGRALDLGCGEGRNAVWLASQGWDATGVDFSGVGLHKAARLATDRGVTVNWIQADVTTWIPPAGEFELVIVFYLHLSPDQRIALHHRAAAALAPGGTILVVGHDLANLADGHGGPQDPTILLNADDVRDDLAGLEITRAEQVRRTVETDNGTRTAIDTLVRATRPQPSTQGAS